VAWKFHARSGLLCGGGESFHAISASQNLPAPRNGGSITAKHHVTDSPPLRCNRPPTKVTRILCPVTLLRLQRQRSKRLRSTAQYGIERTRQGWELKGIPRAVIDKFSRRTAQIERLAQEKGITDPKEKAARVLDY